MSIYGTIIQNEISGKLTGSAIAGSVYGNKIYGRFIDVISIVPPTPSPYGPEATALFLRMTVQPATALKELIDKTIIDLQTAGIWDITDKFHKWDLHTEQASLLDWKNAAHDAANINNASLFPGDGLYTATYNNYVSLNFVPSIDCQYATLNDTAFSLDDLTATPTLAFNFGGYSVDNTSSLLFRTNEDSVKRTWLLSNTSATWRVWNNAVVGGNIYLGERYSATAIRTRRSPTLSIANTASPSVKMVDNNLVVGGHTVANGSVSMQNINTSLFWLGKLMTAEQVVSWYDIMAYWKANVGAATSSIYGLEKATNGNFTSDTDWTKGAGITITDGMAVFTNVASGYGILQNMGLESGKTYRIEFTISELTAGNAMIYLYGSNQYGVSRLGNGTFVQHITATAGVGNLSIITSAASATFKLDNVSVKEML